MEVWKIIFLSKWVICRFHVNLPGCIGKPGMQRKLCHKLWRMSSKPHQGSRPPSIHRWDFELRRPWLFWESWSCWGRHCLTNNQWDSFYDKIQLQGDNRILQISFQFGSRNIQLGMLSFLESKETTYSSLGTDCKLTILVHKLMTSKRHKRHFKALWLWNLGSDVSRRAMPLSLSICVQSNCSINSSEWVNGSSSMSRSLMFYCAGSQILNPNGHFMKTILQSRAMVSLSMTVSDNQRQFDDNTIIIVNVFCTRRC